MKKLFLPVIIWLFCILLLVVIPYGMAVIAGVISLLGLFLRTPITNFLLSICLVVFTETFIFIDFCVLSIISFFCLLWFIEHLVVLCIHKEYFFPKEDEEDDDEIEDYDWDKDIILED